MASDATNRCANCRHWDSEHVTTMRGFPEGMSACHRVLLIMIAVFGRRLSVLHSTQTAHAGYSGWFTRHLTLGAFVGKRWKNKHVSFYPKDGVLFGSYSIPLEYKAEIVFDGLNVVGHAPGYPEYPFRVTMNADTPSERQSAIKTLRSCCYSITCIAKRGDFSALDGIVR